jgi:hypothetical protein
MVLKVDSFPDSSRNDPKKEPDQKTDPKLIFGQTSFPLRGFEIIGTIFSLPGSLQIGVIRFLEVRVLTLKLGDPLLSQLKCVS